MDYIKYHYDELLKLLITISSESKIQLEAHGIGNAEEEMATDLLTHFIEYKDELISAELITIDHAKAISEIDSFFSSHDNDEDELFWSGIETHPDWDILRRMAESVLLLMKKDNLTIKISIKNTTSWFSNNITCQEIGIDLVEKYT
jgi:hypothetical protein